MCSRVTMLLFMLVPCLQGCAWGAKYRAELDRQLLTRAAFDLNCPAERLTIVELTTTQKGVEGCGRRATYVWTQTTTESATAGARHEWIKNSETDG